MIVLFKPLRVRMPLPVVVMVPSVQLKAPVTVMLPVPVSVPFAVMDRLDIVMADKLLVRSLFSAALAVVVIVTPPE